MLPSAIDDEPSINIFRLMEYWAEEPPSHVILALRYLGQRKPKSEREASDQLMEAGSLLGQTPVQLPPHIREVADWAEEMKQKHRGLGNGRKP